jgi:hypothetical protein
MRFGVRLLYLFFKLVLLKQGILIRPNLCNIPTSHIYFCRPVWMCLRQSANLNLYTIRRVDLFACLGSLKLPFKNDSKSKGTHGKAICPNMQN